VVDLSRPRSLFERGARLEDFITAPSGTAHGGARLTGARRV